jgi:type VI secretion system secreted protein VgrG
MRSSPLWNLLTVLTLGLTVLACVFVVALFVNPNAPYNPLPPYPAAVPDQATSPATQPVEPVGFPTLPPEWTATSRPSPTRPTATRTRTPAPSDTPEPTETEELASTARTPTRTPTRTATPAPTDAPVLPTNTVPPAGYEGATGEPPGYP